MLGRLLIQRRRVAVALLFTLLASLALWPSSLAAGSTALAGTMATVIIIMAAPNRRRWVEAGAIGLFLSVWFPAALIAPVFLFASALTYGLLYSPLLDRRGPRFTATGTVVSEVAQAIDDTWAAIVPGEADPRVYWSGKLVDFSRDPDDPDLVYMRLRGEDGLLQDASAEFIDRVAPDLAYFAEEHGENEDGEMWLIRHRLRPLARTQTQIESHLVAEDQPLRIALGHWFDDPFRNHLAGFARVHSVSQTWRMIRPPRTKARAA